MSIFSKLFGNNKSASTAKNRLSLMLAHERSVNIPYMEDMQREILEVVKKYTKSSQVHIKTDSNQNINTLEVEVVLG
ncbi:cell division topological specificity factor MinE [Helicobacter anatolicus]|uniref:cell division topological specificity factor MinE n=1 Tax=Helicobacter anatolicus TaxID=2905874 RepID=UPI001E588FD2|nr:cell division topological specificity factor MinE [Helicobacter anatolicus]MCE3036600.1 cell division topological specificity factor MinE [Helicobacter anatolicus]MCE3037760.1 cell division topological specificity factor MinE [Helicobacter anatolicus]MCE3040129.1 cell division topological specificity factor MinE [Helicobacter anatolicus]